MTSPTPHDHLRFDYHLKAEHLHDSLHMERSKRMVKNSIIWLFCVGFITYGALNLNDPAGMGKSFVYMGLLILTMNLSINYLLMPWLINRQIRSIDASSTQQALEVSASGITVHQGKSNQHVLWKEIKRSFRGKHSYLFELDKRVVVVLPFDAVQASGKQAELEQMLQQYTVQK
jgi:hypothetical protein